MQYVIPAGLNAIDVETSEYFDSAEVYGHGNVQRGVLFFTALSMWVLHCHTLTFPLISAEVDHWCRPPGHLNVSTAEWKEWGIPRAADGQYSRCSAYANLLDTNDSRVVPCDEWDYDAEFAPTSIVSHWNLVCGRAWRIVLLNALTMAGALGFLALSGFVVDRTGRKPVALASASLLIISTLGSGFATTYYMYVCTKFLVSGSSSSLFVASSVLLFEISTHQKRVVQHGLSVAVGLTLGDASFAAIGQLTHAAWMVRQLLMVAPTGLVPVGYLLLAESPRWLIAKRRLKNAESVMNTMARANGFRPLGPCVLVAKTEEKLRFMSGTEERAKLSTNVLRRRALVSFSATFSIMFAYYALLVASAARKVTVWAQNVPLVTNLFVAVAMLPVFNRSSRKRLLITAFACTGTSCSLLGIAFSSGRSLQSLAHTVILVAAETTCFVTAVFNLVYFTEAFPAPVRGTVASLSFAFGRLGGVLAAPLSGLRSKGREDLFFALVSVLVYGVAWLLYHMPIDVSVETTRISSPESRSSGVHRTPTAGTTYSKRELLEEMVKTLERPPSRILNKRKSLAQITGLVSFYLNRLCGHRALVSSNLNESTI
ncbi:solute carrier family 22 member 7-like [Haemaphysalis longicornis]